MQARGGVGWGGAGWLRTSLIVSYHSTNLAPIAPRIQCVCVCLSVSGLFYSCAVHNTSPRSIRFLLRTPPLGRRCLFSIHRDIERSERRDAKSSSEGSTGRRGDREKRRAKRGTGAPVFAMELSHAYSSKVQNHSPEISNHHKIITSQFHVLKQSFRELP